MYLKDIIGQTEAKQHLLTLVHETHVPHAMLLYGPPGSGKLPLAIAFARYLTCDNPGSDDACGHCPSCLMMNKLAHPDVHFAFPVVKKKADVTLYQQIIWMHGVNNCLTLLTLTCKCGWNEWEPKTNKHKYL